MTEALQLEHDERRLPISRLDAAPEHATHHLQLCNGLAQLRFEEQWPRCSQARRPIPASLDSITPRAQADLSSRMTNFGARRSRLLGRLDPP